MRRALSPDERRSPPVEYTPLLVGYVVLVSAGALVALIVTLPITQSRDWQALVVSGVVVLVMSRLSVRPVAGQDHLFAATVVLHLGLVVTFGAEGALTAAVAEAIGTLIRVRVGWFRLAFNTSMLFLVDVAAWGVYSLALRAGLDLPWRVGAAALMMGLCHWLVNDALLAGVLCAVDKSFRSARSAFKAVGLQYNVLYGFAAVAFPILHERLGTLGILTLTGPLFAAQLFLIAMTRASQHHNEERQRYIDVVEDQNVSLERSRAEVVRAYDATLIALTNALDARDKETEGHSRRVVEYSMAIGNCLGLDDERLRVLSHGALLHDIGKIGVPDAILLKPAKLTDEEWALMRRHPEVGAAMVRDVEVLRDARRIILHHHEAWDGSGYPGRLRGHQIEQGARIFMVADTCDAITQDRPYRRGASLDQARAEILKYRGRQFDPDVVDAFLGLPEDELMAIVRMRTPPGLDLLFETATRTRYLARLGLGNELISA